MYKRSAGEKIFNVANIALLTCVLFCTLYPFYYVVIASISNGSEVVRGNVVFRPIGVNFNAYRMIPTIQYFGTSYLNTLFYTVFGALASMTTMSMGAYALSRRRLHGRRVIGVLISFTMWFHAGVIPFYLNMDSLGLLDSRLGIIFGFAVNAFYVILLRSYFEGIPVELEEAARIDGMNNFGTFVYIMLPVAMPALATVGLYCVVDRWNGYFYAMILLKDMYKMPLQVLLKKLIVELNVLATVDTSGSFDFTRESMVYAIVVVSILPVVAVYPLAQRFLVKGMTLGAVKG